MQPAFPTADPLWHRLGEVTYHGDIVDMKHQMPVHGLIGAGGSGKTRAMFEVLARRFGFYWVCNSDGHAGASCVSRAVAALRAHCESRDVIWNVVDRLLLIFAVMFLVWRRVHPNGTPLDWLVFQTAPDVDRVVCAVAGRLASFTADSANCALCAVVDTLPKWTGLVVVVDEAQALADLPKTHFEW